MNTIIFNQRVSSLVGVSTVALLGISLPAIAQTADTSTQTQTNPVLPITETNTVTRLDLTPNQEQVSAIATPNTEPNLLQTQENFSAIATPETDNPTFTPVPGTVATSSTALVPQKQESNDQVPTDQVAQTDILPGQATRGGSSYIGIAANIGIAGNDSSLGDGNFMVISKIGLSNAISVRPSAVIGDDTTILVPLTYDFSFQQLDPFNEPLPISPYVGAGAAIKTGDDSQFSFLLSGGVDFPLNRQFTATAAVNAAFFDDTDIGLTLGVGYNFGL